MEKTKMMMLFEPHQEKNLFKLFIYDTVTKEGTFDWSRWKMIDSKTSAQYFADQLSQIPDNAELELYINSNGGSVSEGVTIYNQLKRHPAKKTGYVDGVAYSVASLILQACDTRVMGLGTSMLVHNMWVSIDGNAAMLRKTADDLDNWMKANKKVYLERCSSKMSEEELSELMDQERILTPDECLEYGFIDEISESIPDASVPEEDNQEEEKEKDVNPIQMMQIKTMQQFLDTRQSLLNSIQMLKVGENDPQQSQLNNEPDNKSQQNEPCEAFFSRFFS